MIMQRALSYIAVGALAALGGAALWLAAHPNVSDEYRAYFIDRSTDCWANNVVGSLPLSGRIWFVTADNAGAKAVLECGWIAPEATGTWSSGREAKLAVRPQGAGPWDVELDLLPFSPPQRVTIVAKGETLLETVLVQGGTIQHRLRLLPTHLDADGRAVLSVALPDGVSPSDLGLAPDPRKLAVRLLSLRVSAASP